MISDSKLIFYLLVLLGVFFAVFEIYLAHTLSFEALIGFLVGTVLLFMLQIISLLNQKKPPRAKPEPRSVFGEILNKNLMEVQQ